MGRLQSPDRSGGFTLISIAVIGAQGYVGKSICDALYSLNAHNDGLVAVFPVVRGNYEEAKNEKYDIIINSAMPSGRFGRKRIPDRTL